MANAKFKISSSLFIDGGYDATHGQVLQLQLEDQPPADVSKCQYTIGMATLGAPTPTVSTSMGIASPVGSVVELTMPGSGIVDYEVICTVNNGVDSEGKVRADYVSSRIVAIRSNEGLRKILPAETTEYDRNEGWASAINEMVEAIDTLAAGSGTVTSVTGTSPINVATGTTTPVVSISPATTSVAGSMSASDKTKLNGVGVGANVVSVIAGTAIIVDQTDPQNPIVNLDLLIEGNSPINVYNADPLNPILSIDAATGSTAGSMSAADKAKLDASTYLPTAGELVEFGPGGNLYANKIVAPEWFSEASPMTIGMDGVGVSIVTFTDVPSMTVACDVTAPGFKLKDAITGLYRSAPLDWRGAMVSGAESWVSTSTGTCKQNVINAGAELYVQLDPQHTSVLTHVKFRSRGAGLTSDPDPGTLPTYTVIRQHVETLVETVTGTGPDGAAAMAADYRDKHWTEITCSNHVVDRVNYRYYAKLTPEYGADSQVGFQLDSVLIGYDLPVGFSIGLN